MMRRIHTQRDKVMKSSGRVCLVVQKILEDNKKKAHEYIFDWNAHDKFEVKGWFGDRWTMDLTSKLYSCKKWELTRIPCVHAKACTFYRREKVEDYVEFWYKKETFLKSYSYLLHLLKGQQKWPESTLVPLVLWLEKPKRVGRPRKHDRRKEPDEKGQQKVVLKRNGAKYSCSRCE